LSELGNQEFVVAVQRDLSLQVQGVRLEFDGAKFPVLIFVLLQGKAGAHLVLGKRLLNYPQVLHLRLEFLQLLLHVERQRLQFQELIRFPLFLVV